MGQTTNAYQPIEDYGAIGNLRTVALVGRNGSIDWLCCPHIDSPSVFARLLDAQRGGCFRISVVGQSERGEQRYVEDTNVLETWFDTPNGRLHITDFLPLTGSIEGCGDSDAPPHLCRIVQVEGEVEVELTWAPRLDYGRATTHISREGGGYAAHGEKQSVFLAGVPDADAHVWRDDLGQDTLQARFHFESGGTRAIVMSWGEFPATISVDDAMGELEATVSTWRRWAHKDTEWNRSWAEPWDAMVMRSELVLKLLTHGESGAVAAAATSSLPETIGGVRNWDYRYAWIRDAAMTGQAFVAMNHYAEMRDFVDWVERVSRKEQEADRRFQIAYTVHGTPLNSIEELDAFEGYRGSRPVRIGNEAVHQQQHDILGELMDAPQELVASGIDPGENIWEFLPRVADVAAKVWEEPDHGLWEMPLEPKHYVYSKLMVWVALDRAVNLAEGGRLKGDVRRWQKARDNVREMILRRGYSEKRKAFVQTLDGDALDAATLMIPVEGLLPFDDPRVQNTIDRIMDELTENGLVRRYVVDDGLPGEEGGWVLCTTWLVDNLALSGRREEAERIFEGMATRANHLGLFAEQIDPASGAFLGNFPQAFSHIGFINSAVFIGHAKGRKVPAAIPGISGPDTAGRSGERP